METERDPDLSPDASAPREHAWFPKPLRGPDAVKCLDCGYTALTERERQEADAEGCEPGT